MARIPDLDDFLDPKSLSPQQLYTLQSETWAQGAEAERERIIKLLNIWDCNNDRCDCDSIDDCVYRQQLIALIKGEQK